MNSKEEEFAEVISIKPATEFQKETEKHPATGRLAEPRPDDLAAPGTAASARPAARQHPLQKPFGRKTAAQPKNKAQSKAAPSPPAATPASAATPATASVSVRPAPASVPPTSPRVEPAPEPETADVFTQPIAPPQMRLDTPQEKPPTPTSTLRNEAVAQAYTMPKVKPFTRPLRILHITNVETTNYYLNNLCDYTDRRAVTYIVVTLGKEGSFTKDLDRRGIQVYALNCRQRHQYPRALYQLHQILQKERIDIVHTHLVDPTLLGMLIAKLRQRGIVVTRHHSDAVYLLPSKMKRDVYLKLEDWINQAADHIIAPSQMVRDILVRREHVPESKVSLIPYGQTMERFNGIKPELIEKVRNELGMQERLSMLCVSRLHWEKGHRFLLEAFALLRDEGIDATLYLVGIGPDREMLESLARELDVGDRVRFLGWRDDALLIMAAADIIVHASLQEALPSVVIEALMLERPIVVTDVSGVRDIIGNSKHGIIVPPRNTEALYAALGWTIQNLEQARSRAHEGRRFVLEYMGAERVAREYFNVYRQVMKSHLQKVAAKDGKISADTQQILDEAE